MARTINVAAKTDRGRRRRENEDSILVREYSAPGTRSGVGYLLAVADGMGGAAGGQVASSTALRALDESATQWAADPTNGLPRAIEAANATVRGVALEKPELMGMATTLVSAFVADGKAWFANVGDSRGYLIRDGHIQRITHDHSWVGEQVRAGVMTEEEAGQHPRRNIITRSVGSDERAQPDVFPPIELQDCDCIVLCSDGLHGLVRDEEIAAICLSREPGQAADELVALANERGGPDNISVVIGRVGSGGANTMVFRMSRRDDKRPVALVAAVGTSVAALMAVAALFLLSGGDGTGEQSNSVALASTPSVLPGVIQSTSLASPSVVADSTPTPAPTEPPTAISTGTPTPTSTLEITAPTAAVIPTSASGTGGVSGLQLAPCTSDTNLQAGTRCLVGDFDQVLRGGWCSLKRDLNEVGVALGIPGTVNRDLILETLWFYNIRDTEGTPNTVSGPFYLPLPEGKWPSGRPAEFDAAEYDAWIGQPCPF